jgi:hypothetical protein
MKRKNNKEEEEEDNAQTTQQLLNGFHKEVFDRLWPPRSRDLNLYDIICGKH